MSVPPPAVSPTRDKAPLLPHPAGRAEGVRAGFTSWASIEEHVSSLESLHDDIYFDTLDLLQRGGQVRQQETTILPGGRSLAAGNILPWIHPEQSGARLRSLTITYSGFASKEPKLVVKYREKGTPRRTTTLTRGHWRRCNVPADPYVYLAESGGGPVSGLARVGVPDQLERTPRANCRAWPLLLDNLGRLQREANCVPRRASVFEGVGSR